MAYVRPFIKVTFGGDLAQGQEIWSCNFHLGITDPLADPDEIFEIYETLMGPMSDDLVAYFTRSGTRVPSGVRLRWFKLALIDTDGSYMRDSVEIPLNATGATSGGYLPQVAIVNTLVAPKYKDPGKYNRFYLPVATPNLSNEFSLSAPQQTAYLTSLKTFMEDLYETCKTVPAGSQALPSVISGTATGSQLPITGIRIGRIIDSQRRRRNALQEQYEEADIVG